MKEAELEEAAAALESIAAEESSLTAGFDDALGDLERQRAEISAEEGGRSAALEALAAAHGAAAEAEAAAAADRARLLQQVWPGDHAAMSTPRLRARSFQLWAATLRRLPPVGLSVLYCWTSRIRYDTRKGRGYKIDEQGFGPAGSRENSQDAKLMRRCPFRISRLQTQLWRGVPVQCSLLCMRCAC